MFCPNCGNQIPDGYSFCSYCGTQFDNSYANQQPQYPYQQPQYQQQYQQPQYAAQQDPPKKGVNLMGVIAGAAALLVVGGIAAGIFFFGGRDSGRNTPDKPVSGDHVQQAEEQEKQEEDQRFSGWAVSAKWEYDKEGNLLRGRQYSYDLLGRLDKEYYCNSDGEPYQCVRYEYDLTGGYTKTNYTLSDNSVNVVEKYDANGEQYLRTVYNDDGTVSLRHEMIFDELGRIIAKDAYEKSGEFVARSEFSYDEQGNRTLEVYYEAGIEQGRVVAVYDEKGNMIRQERIPNKEVDPYSDPDIYEYTYDEQGNLIRMQHIFQDRTYDHEIYFYDDENRMVLMHRFIDHYNGWQEMSRFEVYNYDEKGQLILEGYGHSYDTSKSAPEYGAFYKLTTYEYDTQGRVAVESSYGAGKIFEQKHTEYREDSQIAYIRHTNGEGLLTGETIFTYDGSGNLLSRCYTEEKNETSIPKPNFTLYEYTYDEHGNVTSEKYYRNQETLQYHYEYEYTFIP